MPATCSRDCHYNVLTLTIGFVMDFINDENFKAYWHLIVLGSIIIILLGLFIFKFLVPSVILGNK